MVLDPSLPPVFFQLLYLFRIRSGVAEGPIDADQLGVRNGDDCTLTSPPELHSLITYPEK